MPQASRPGTPTVDLKSFCLGGLSNSTALSCRDGKTIVFFSTKHSAHRAKILFGLAGLPPSAELHGNMTQAARLESLERFRKVLTPHLSSSS